MVVADVFGAEDEHHVVAFDAVAAIVVACLKIVAVAVIVAVVLVGVVAVVVDVAVVVCCFLETGMHDCDFAYCSCCCCPQVVLTMMLEWM